MCVLGARGAPALFLQFPYKPNNSRTNCWPEKTEVGKEGNRPEWPC